MFQGRGCYDGGCVKGTLIVGVSSGDVCVSDSGEGDGGCVLEVIVGVLGR